MLWKTLKASPLVERIVLGVLALIFLVSSLQIGQAFYIEHSEPAAGDGGTYVEGVTGEFQFFNPVLAQTDLDRDVTSLVFAGLMRYDPVTGTVVDDLAVHTLSGDQRTYTFTLREGLTWHDGSPVTADDVVFTYRDIVQHPDFPNKNLAADFKDVQVAKIDDRTVAMTLKNKYAFFIYNTTIGLLPQHLLAGTPVTELLSAPFNLQPVGAGPYVFDSATTSQIRLSAFEKYHRGAPHLDTFIFRVFESEEQLFKNLGGLTGTKNLPADRVAGLKNDARVDLHTFTLPQYAALFFNTDRPILKNEKTRLGLQLATDRAAIVQEIGTAETIDTPLLEIAQSDWKYDFSAERADGALFDAGWRYPAVTPPTPTPRAATPAANPPADTTARHITLPTAERYYATDATSFFLGGSAPAGTTAIIVNGYQIKKYTPGQAWSYRAATAIGTLKSGEQDFIIQALVGGAKKEIDRVTVFQSGDATARDAWLAGKTKPTVAAATPTPTPPVETKKPAATEHIRVDGVGAPLALTLITPAEQDEFGAVAELVQSQWRERGVKLTVESLPQDTFIERLHKRDYDIALFGQNLGYNLDAYAFWHSAEARENGGNLSNLKSANVNAWLEQIRGTFDPAERKKRLASLRDAIAEDVPAVVLYTPTYTFAVDKKLKNFNLGKIALKRDRFANADGWYVRESRAMRDDVNAWTAVVWFVTDAWQLSFGEDTPQTVEPATPETTTEVAPTPAAPAA